MKITQVVVFSEDELKSIVDGEIYAFVNPGDDREILLMSEDRYSEWKEANCGFVE